MSTKLILRFKNGESCLQLEFEPNGDKALDGVAIIEQGALNLKFDFYCFGYDLEEFAKSISFFHASYNGVAKFKTQSGEIEVGLSLVNRGRGIVGAVAIFKHWVVWPADYARVHDQAELHPYVFNGFTVDQSYLPNFVSEIRQFLADAHISTIHPMIHETL